MPWKAMGAQEYRALELPQLEARRDEIAAELDNPESEVDTKELRSEVELCKAEFARRNSVAQVRALDIHAVSAGSGAKLEKRDFAQSADEDDDPTNTLEYRKAFMQYAMRGKKTEALASVMSGIQSRADANTLTTDVPAVIPTVLVNRILEKAESLGMILPLVTKTNYPAGMEIPVASLKPVATWVSEGATSDKQKYTANQKITFTHHKLRCEVSISMEVSVMTLSAFESKIVETVARAMTVAKEQAILTGTGTGQPKGILSETPATGQAIVLESGAGVSYQTLVDCEAALPQAYEANVKWFMHKKTFMAFVGMVDDQGQPIARVNYGIGGKPERTLLGREVVLTGDYLPSFDAAPEEKTVYAFMFDMSDYVLNSNYDMGIQRRQDWDTEDLQTKAVTAVDGKVIDVNSLVTLAVDKAAAGLDSGPQG